MSRPSVAAAILVMLAAGHAAAGKVALSSIDGDDKGDVREAIVDAFDGSELSFVSEKATNRAVDKAGGDVTAMSEKQIQKLAKDLSVEAIIVASVDKDGGSKTLKFKLYVSSGKKLKGFSVQFASSRSKKFKEALAKKITEKLASAGEATEKKDKEKDGEDGEKVAKKDKKKKDKKKKDKEKDGEDGEKVAKKDKDKEKDGEDGEKVAKKDKEKEKDGEEGGDGEDGEKEKALRPKEKSVASAEDGEEDGEEASVTVRASGKARAANRVAVRLDVGLSMAARRLAFTTRGDLASEDRPAPFKPTPVPGARLEVEVYPLAFMSPNSPAAGIGIAAEYDKVVSSKVAASGGPEDGTVATVNQQVFSIGARYRLAFGKTPTSPSLTAGLNYGRRTFKVNDVFMDRANLDLPDTDYKYLSPLLGFRVPITKNLAFIAQGEALLIRDAGPIQKQDSYGQAKVFGIDGMGGLDIVIGNRFAVRVVGEYAQIGYSFTGNGALANNRDGDDTTQDIGGALDRSFGGTATLAVLY
jgi:hypothetical protein